MRGKGSTVESLNAISVVASADAIGKRTSVGGNASDTHKTGGARRCTLNVKAGLVSRIVVPCELRRTFACRSCEVRRSIDEITIRACGNRHLCCARRAAIVGNGEDGRKISRIGVDVRRRSGCTRWAAVAEVPGVAGDGLKSESRLIRFAAVN